MPFASMDTPLSNRHALTAPGLDTVSTGRFLTYCNRRHRAGPENTMARLVDELAFHVESEIRRDHTQEWDRDYYMDRLTAICRQLIDKNDWSKVGNDFPEAEGWLKQLDTSQAQAARQEEDVTGKATSRRHFLKAGAGTVFAAFGVNGMRSPERDAVVKSLAVLGGATTGITALGDLQCQELLDCIQANFCTHYGVLAKQRGR